MNWYLAVLKNYVGFGGRARRKEYWMFVLGNFVVAVVLGIIGVVIHTAILTTIYGLAVLIPGLAVGFRRLHDGGHTAWWLLFGVIPVIGWITLLVFVLSDSQPGDNRFGPNPKQVGTAM